VANPDLSKRTCRECKQVKLNEEFHKAKTGVNGRYQVCKTCRKITSAKKYKDNWFVFTCRLKKAYCKKRGIAFDLTPDYLKSIFTDSCPVFGRQFEEGKKSHYSATLDRVDPSKGYVQGNVCYISHRANRIKYDASIEELKQILGWLERATTSP
jgi:hypothetical protein